MRVLLVALATMMVTACAPAAPKPVYTQPANDRYNVTLPTTEIGLGQGDNFRSQVVYFEYQNERCYVVREWWQGNFSMSTSCVKK